MSPRLSILQQDVVDWDASKITNETIFKAAFLAIASNMRRWAKFRTTRPEAEGLLAGLDPTAVAKEIARDEGNRLSQKLAQLLGGQTARSDAKAILKWANLLTENKHWADRPTPLFASTEFEPRLQLADLVVGSAREFVNFALKDPSKKESFGVKRFKTLMPNL